MKRNHDYRWPENGYHHKRGANFQLRTRLRQQEAIAWFGEYALECERIDELIQKAVDLTTRTLKVDLCSVWVYGGEGEHLVLKAGWGWNEGQVGNLVIQLDEHPQAALLLAPDKPVILKDVQGKEGLAQLPLMGDHQVASGISVVIMGAEKPWGALGVFTRSPRDFSEEEALFLGSIANILASALKRARMEEDLRASRDDLQIILNGVSEAILVQDCEGRIVFVNQMAADMLGFVSVDALMAARSEQLLTPYQMFDEAGNPFPAERLPTRGALQGVAGSSARARIKKNGTGSNHWVIMEANPVRDLSGNVIQAVSIFRDITDLVRSQNSQKLLAEAGELLASSLDYETTLRNLATLAVTELADGCTVHLVSEGGVNQLTVAHRDPEKIEQAIGFQKRFPPNWAGNGGLARVLRSGQAEFYPDISDAMLVEAARDEDHLAALRELSLSAMMILPLKVFDRTWGAITLVWNGPGRKYGAAEKELAQELARRASIAIENARLYQEAQELNSELELRVERRTEELETSIRMLWNEIEERKRVEEALRQSEAMLHSLFESAPDATILVDASGKIVQVNRPAEAVFGYGRKEMIGQPVEMLIPRKYHKRHGAHRTHYFEKVEARPMGAGLELYAVRKDGSEFPVDVMLSPVKTDKGDLVISAVRDITAQKRLQKELEETHRRLFESIEAERRTLSQELHDGPMQELYGLTYGIEALRPVLQDKPELADLANAQATIQGVIETLRAICGELRPPTLTHFGLEKAIRSHLNKISEKNPDLKFMIHMDGLKRPLPERTQLALFRVYQNSVSNILRHARATQVLVDFKLDGDDILFKIQDDGQGFQMPARLVELARAGHFGLVGMKERVEALGGRLRVESAPGQGTTIEVEVPVGEEN